MNLLLDLGNSRLKWALADERELRRDAALEWQVPNFRDSLLLQWQKLPEPRHILAAAVAPPEQCEQLAAIVQAMGWGSIEWLRSPVRKSDLTNAYKIPADLGIDRFLAMLWAVHAERMPCVMVSCGTALTLDAVDAQGRHLGGLIVPGVHAMTQALHVAVPALPRTVDGRILPMAQSTADAIASGPWQAVAGAIERFAQQAEARIGAKPQVLLSGGHARPVADLMVDQTNVHVCDSAVLQGLLVWSQVN